MWVAGSMLGVENEAMGLVDEVEGLVAAEVVGIDDVAEVREVSVE